MTIRTTPAVVAALVLVLITGCTGGGDPAGGEVASPLAACTGLDAPPTQAATAPGSGGTGLPALELPCFTGGAPFVLADLRGPAVVNLWASWCPPCREELPVLQRYADQQAGRVHVVGVVTDDRRSAAASLAEDLGVTFPALDDPDARLLAEVNAVALPVTLFVDGDGRVAYLHQAGELDEAALAQLGTEHLGVAG